MQTTCRKTYRVKCTTWVIEGFAARWYVQISSFIISIRPWSSIKIASPRDDRWWLWRHYGLENEEESLLLTASDRSKNGLQVLMWHFRTCMKKDCDNGNTLKFDGGIAGLYISLETVRCMTTDRSSERTRKSCLGARKSGLLFSLMMMPCIRSMNTS